MNLDGLPDLPVQYQWFLTGPTHAGTTYAGLITVDKYPIFLYMMAEENSSPVLEFATPCCGYFTTSSNLDKCRNCGSLYELGGLAANLILTRVTRGDCMILESWLDAMGLDPLRASLLASSLSSWKNEITGPAYSVPAVNNQGRVTVELQARARLSLGLPI